MKLRSRKYWAERIALIEDHIHKKVKLTENKIKELNKSIERKLNRQITYWVNRFAENNELTKQAAKETLNNSEFVDFKYDLEDYIRMGKESHLNPDWLEIMENMRARYNISRLESLKVHLRHFSELYTALEYPIVEDLIISSAKESYYMTQYELAKGLDTKVNLYKLDEAKLSLLIHKPWTPDGVEFSERIWGIHRKKLINSLYNRLDQSFTAGTPAHKMADDLAKEFGVHKSDASNLLYTESAFMAEQTRADVYEELGVKEYEIVATLDTRTSEICQEMDGKVFKLEDLEVGVNAPPFHARCRTTKAPYFEDDRGLGVRAARDKDGKTIYVPDDMTYPEYYKKYIE